MRDVPDPVVAVPPPAETSGAGEGAALLRSPRRFEPDRKTATQRLIERAAERKARSFPALWAFAQPESLCTYSMSESQELNKLG